VENLEIVSQIDHNRFLSHHFQFVIRCCFHNSNMIKAKQGTVVDSVEVAFCHSSRAAE